MDPQCPHAQAGRRWALQKQKELRECVVKHKCESPGGCRLRGDKQTRRQTRCDIGVDSTVRPTWSFRRRPGSSGARRRWRRRTARVCPRPAACSRRSRARRPPPPRSASPRRRCRCRRCPSRDTPLRGRPPTPKSNSNRVVPAGLSTETHPWTFVPRCSGFGNDNLTPLRKIGSPCKSTARHWSYGNLTAQAQRKETPSTSHLRQRQPHNQKRQLPLPCFRVQN
jgi:hypothetical protein